MCKLKMCMCIFGKILGGWFGVGRGILDGFDGDI
jgi:hypothetical protein